MSSTNGDTGNTSPGLEKLNGATQTNQGNVAAEQSTNAKGNAGACSKTVVTTADKKFDVTVCEAKIVGGKKKAAAKPKKVFYNKSTRASVVYIDGPSKRKFIKVAGSVIFLDTVRGKYRYAK
jgi:hypothetical protein